MNKKNYPPKKQRQRSTPPGKDSPMDKLNKAMKKIVSVPKEKLIKK